MRYLSLFHGIGAVDLAWLPLGWECAAYAEIESFPIAVTSHHHPAIPNLGDVTKITDEQIAALGHIDLVVGGSPCQDLSVAGKRAGLAGERSGLFHEQIRIFHAARSFCGARFLLWENVPGAFSSHGGRDFGIVVGSMVGCEFGIPRDGWRTSGAAAGPHGLVEWRVLDAQYVRVESHPRAVPQRRRRVFALLDAGDWRDRPPILFERESLCGHPPPRREAGERITHSIAPCIGASGRGFERGGDTKGFDASEDGTGRGVPLVPDVSPAMKARDAKGPSSDGDGDGLPLIPVATPVGFAQNQRDEVREDVSGDVTHPLGAQDNGMGVGIDLYNGQVTGDVAATMGTPGSSVNASGPTVMSAMQAPAIAMTTLTATNDPSRSPQSSEVTQQVSAVHASTMQVRRLTPRECERLQGFPDDYTLIQVRGKPAADGPRYRALGNSMAVNVMRWIGERIDAIK